jgi:hypothetical protein
MSFELQIISALASSVASSVVAEKIYDLIKSRLKESGLDKGKMVASSPIQTGRDVVIKSDRDPLITQEELENFLQKKEQQLTPVKTRNLTLDAIQTAHEAANGIRTERMRQAKFTFNAALSLAVIGVLIIFAGVSLLLFRDAVAAGSITAGIGAVTEVVSAILFRLNHETNNRLDEIGRDLSAIETTRIAMTLIDKITDPTKKDDAIKELAKDLRSRKK